MIAAAAALAALVVEIVGLGAPQILRAIREPAYAIQFCLVLSTDTDTGCVTVCFARISAHLACQHSSIVTVFISRIAYIRLDQLSSAGKVPAYPRWHC